MVSGYRCSCTSAMYVRGRAKPYIIPNTFSSSLGHWRAGSKMYCMLAKAVTGLSPGNQAFSFKNRVVIFIYIRNLIEEFILSGLRIQKLHNPI